MRFDPPFTRTLVQPGDPLTAQAWNDIVNAVGAVYDHLESSEASSVKVQIAAAGIDLGLVRVNATRSDGISAEAVRPVPPGTAHTFPGLAPDSYEIRAEAPGFDVGTMNLVVPPAGLTATQNLALTKRGNFMPMTFGMKLTSALAQLATLNIAVNQVLDVTGNSVPVATPGAAYGDSLVLMQFPPAGVPVGPGEASQLVISAALQAEASIEMPSLVGLTLAEATKALEAIGLRPGKSFTKKKVPTTLPPGQVGGGFVDDTPPAR
jgi:hypothetical protein